MIIIQYDYQIFYPFIIYFYLLFFVDRLIDFVIIIKCFFENKFNLTGFKIYFLLQ